ncbi:tRNA uracil 4-sulfurtransferase ThiI [uncultured Clostridium sp.]|uniref:tRNA uracil 4-sulfurtransferase ThiI n=1 Tax=uncultured Clostridium sp. TaxID=59620 RepID=UPI002610BA1B|nr:tRNA uracil 4-sulfurtransferase ThiI [uncultured Clostridium sp.]
MRKLILVKYASEIFLKGLNKNKFEKKLRDNIKKKLKGLEYEFIIDQGRYFIKVDDLEEGIDRVKKVFGVAEVCIVTEVERDLDVIKAEVVKKINEVKPKTFKIVTNRANKVFHMNSMEISRDIGGFVLDNYKGELSVDVKKPECLVNVEIRERAYVFTSSDKVKGAGGLPYGMNGGTMLMLSGGIDSPVAGYLMARRGVELNCVYYHSHPYTSERAKDKVKELAEILAGYTGKVRLFIVPFTEIQMEIIDKCPGEELTIIMRRFMMKVACAIADKDGIQSVATGESIGQVASQTMEGLVVSSDCADRPVFRPLIAMDKGDIMDIAREIGTYETSILPYEDCCTIFVPKHPKTKPRLEEIKKSESVLDVDSLVEKAVNEAEIVVF